MKPVKNEHVRHIHQSCRNVEELQSPEVSLNNQIIFTNKTLVNRSPEKRETNRNCENFEGQNLALVLLLSFKEIGFCKLNEHQNCANDHQHGKSDVKIAALKTVCPRHFSELKILFVNIFLVEEKVPLCSVVVSLASFDCHDCKIETCASKADNHRI